MLLFIYISEHDSGVNKNFNTSHVTVYLPEDYKLESVYEFQYISCYCLSIGIPNVNKWSYNFNTSHVTVYQILVTSDEYALLISIHLMLLFIKQNEKLYDLLERFQYISCYCLSRSSMFAFLFSLHFNTSHVTVYPIRSFLHFSVPEFQYISCYCLSNELTPFYIFLRI